MAQAQELPCKRSQTIDRDKMVEAALTQIQKNYRSASLTEVAQAYGASLAYVSVCVKAQTGKSFKTLLQKRRLEVAARLLRSSDLKVRHIIRQVGYENSSYFFGLFNKRYGLTPTEYRTAYRRNSSQPSSFS